MSSPRQQRLVHEATQHGTEVVLQRMPVEYSLELEQGIRQGIRQALLYYASGLDSWEERLQPLDPAATVSV